MEQLAAPPERLVAVGKLLLADGYQFVTPTPLTHDRVLSRASSSSDLLASVFGWNLAISALDLPPQYRPFLQDQALFRAQDEMFVSNVRYSTLGGLLFAHSGFPTTGVDAVFFGPDTYRFARAISGLRDRERDFRPARVLDIGAGSGAGGIIAGQTFPTASEIVLSDVSPAALKFAQANAILNRCDAAKVIQSDIMGAIEGPADLIISNPPYLLDAARRAYRHGGGAWGGELAGRILEQAMNGLTGAGHLLLYTGTPIVGGEDMFLRAALLILKPLVRHFHYEEIDPDVFGEELGSPPYDRADRIAAVVLHVNAKDLIS